MTSVKERKQKACRILKKKEGIIDPHEMQFSMCHTVKRL